MILNTLIRTSFLFYYFFLYFISCYVVKCLLKWKNFKFFANAKMTTTTTTTTTTKIKISTKMHWKFCGFLYPRPVAAFVVVIFGFFFI